MTAGIPPNLACGQAEGANPGSVDCFMVSQLGENLSTYI